VVVHPDHDLFRFASAVYPDVIGRLGISPGGRIHGLGEATGNRREGTDGRVGVIAASKYLPHVGIAQHAGVPGLLVRRHRPVTRPVGGDRLHAAERAGRRRLNAAAAPHVVGDVGVIAVRGGDVRVGVRAARPGQGRGNTWRTRPGRTRRRIRWRVRSCARRRARRTCRRAGRARQRQDALRVPLDRDRLSRARRGSGDRYVGELPGRQAGVDGHGVAGGGRGAGQVRCLRGAATGYRIATECCGHQQAQHGSQRNELPGIPVNSHVPPKPSGTPPSGDPAQGPGSLGRGRPGHLQYA
jgi:hypothetical protein